MFSSHVSTPPSRDRGRIHDLQDKPPRWTNPQQVRTYFWQRIIKIIHILLGASPCAGLSDQPHSGDSAAQYPSSLSLSNLLKNREANLGYSWKVVTWRGLSQLPCIPTMHARARILRGTYPGWRGGVGTCALRIGRCFNYRGVLLPAPQYRSVLLASTVACGFCFEIRGGVRRRIPSCDEGRMID